MLVSSMDKVSYDNFDIVFLPENRVVRCNGPLSFADAAAQAELLVEHPCGSRGTCGKCRVRFHLGAPAPGTHDKQLLSPEALASGWRLACQVILSSPAVMEVPDVSRVASPKSFGPDDLFASGFDPFLKVHSVLLPPAELGTQLSGAERLANALGFSPSLGLDQLRVVGEADHCSKRLELVLDEARALWVGDPGGRGVALGLALDVGSTSLAGALVDLESGKVICSASVLNQQIQYGADVISRIDHAQIDKAGNHNLHAAVVSTINELIEQLLSSSGALRNNIWLACAAGNSVMLHTLMGVDVRALGRAPYIGAWVAPWRLRAHEVGLNLRAEAALRLFPMIRSNVGGDTVAAIIAAGLDMTEKLTLLIDLGTNCEVVLGNRDGILATSTAAGPAFEGANIRCGMRAAPGAIDRISLRPGGELSIHVIGSVRPRGICGSALVDAAALFLRTGVMDASGRMRGPETFDADLAPLRDRLVRDETGQPAVVLAQAMDSATGESVTVGARDIRQLQLVKGSILAGVVTLLRTRGATMDDVEQVFIAGAFGSYLRKTSVMDVGLVPATDPERVQCIGNAAGVGARMALVDRLAWRRAEAVHRAAQYIELGGLPEYQDLFAESMGFHDSPALVESAR